MSKKRSSNFRGNSSLVKKSVVSVTFSMSPIDYSKWDKLDVGSDDETNGRQPQVTAFEKPHSITLTSTKKIIAREATPGVGPKNFAPEGSTPQGKLPSRSAKNGAVFDDYAWEQDHSHVYFWFRLPQGAVLDSRRSERQVELLLDRPPADSNPPSLPEALIASDFDEAHEDAPDIGLFPVSWGLKLTWPVQPNTALPSRGGTVWQTVDMTENRVHSRSMWFWYPVMRGDSTWIWSMEESCPLTEWSMRVIKVELKKKQSQSLHNISLVWTKGLLTESEPIVVQTTPQQQAVQDAFRKTWDEAHSEFKKKIANRTPMIIH